MGHPLVYAVVLNWNGYEDTVACLNSIEGIDYPNFQTIVVDNGSNDGSGEKIEDSYPDISVLYNQENLGFSGGMNTGIRYAIDSGADYVWILNNDTIIPESLNLIQRLISPLEESSSVGMTSPLIVRDGTDLVWFIEGKVNSSTLNAKHIGDGEPVDQVLDGQPLLDTDYVPLCAAMIDIDMIHSVGLLDERYFLYYEDVDYSWRARKDGYYFQTVTDVSVEHKVSQSTGQNLGPLNSYYAARNRILFWRKWGEYGMLQFVLGYLLWLVLLTGNRILNLRIQGLKGLYWGVWDGLREIEGRGPYP